MKETIIIDLGYTMRNPTRKDTIKQALSNIIQDDDNNATIEDIEVKTCNTTHHHCRLDPNWHSKLGYFLFSVIQDTRNPKDPLRTNFNLWDIIQITVKVHYKILPKSEVLELPNPNIINIIHPDK